MDIKKRRQHYVFQAYLNAWTNDEKLWCMRNNKKFNTGTINVAQERDFYRINPLNKDEEKFYDLFVSRKSPDVQKALYNHKDAYLKPLEWQSQLKLLKDILKIKFGNDKAIPVEIKDEISKLDHMVDISLNNIEEDYHSDIEGEGTKWINLLQKEITNFCYGSDKFDFIFFICTQYFRTKSVKKRWISNFEPCLNHPQFKNMNIQIENVDLENLSHLFFWEIQNSAAYSLSKNDAHLTLLINNTNIPFITSDQPVINLCANYQQLCEKTTELIFYYPISPSVAIILNDNSLADRVEVDEKNVDEYNNAIINASYESVFANSEDILDRYIRT